MAALDAIPYLVERDGTNCENLPETHEAIKRIRAEIDAHYTNRMILAEANQWPTDVRPYFGDGDECHMTFHFPLMPRIYMALRQEDRLPITDIMAQTPEIPGTCQWGLFLRNHDELTLEMVTNDERDYMYLAYSADPRMRINLGIRRRLAPLVDNNRRRIELLNSLLFSFPGTPIIYYGDEIGMGDNIYLGDRNGVRTPMQWSGDRNAGFSRATPARLYSPVIMDPVFGYEAVNVEAQQSDQASLLTWMRNMIALRKLFRLFGRGTLEFLNPSNRKILAYIRKYEHERVLCVANLSRFAQPVDLDLPALEGMAPIEMLGYVEFPPITRQPYRLTLAPYGFLWLELHEAPERAPEIQRDEWEESKLSLSDGWATLFEGSARYRFESVLLPAYLVKQRWFAANARRVESTLISDWTILEGCNAAVCVVLVNFDDGSSESYFLPLAISFGKEGDSVRDGSPNFVISGIRTAEADGLVYDGICDERVCTAFLTLIQKGGEWRTQRGTVRGIPGLLLPQMDGASEELMPGRRCPVPHRHTTILYGEKFVVKLFHRQEGGLNPDVEIAEYLTEKVHFEGTPPFAGSIQYSADGGERAAWGMLQGFVGNEGDGWTWTVEELERYYETCAPLEFPRQDAPKQEGDFFELSEQPTPALARDHIGIYLDSAATLGRRTAEMHLALASPADDSDFSPEQTTPQDLTSLVLELREQATRAFDLLKEQVSRLPDDLIEVAGLVLSRRRQILESFRRLDERRIQAVRTRIHGNYYLGQVLRSKTNYIILDFEGEPFRPLAQRRAKQSPLKDVAGMLRSFSYGAYATLMNYTARRPEDLASLIPWARLWERSTAAAFLRAYRETAGEADYLPSDPDDFRQLLKAFLLDKALYELVYELNNRPAWVRIPLEGILSLPV
jgi:maltose alpha-D-glucosyltransferase / alpha-amylase